MRNVNGIHREILSHVLYKMSSVLFLCAGYGTRLSADVVGNAEYQLLDGLPKGLVPLAGRPLLSWWVELFCEPNSGIKVEHLFFITNNLYFERMKQWATDSGIPKQNVITDGETTNKNGSLGTMLLAYEHFKLAGKNILIVASDTLITSFDVCKFIGQCQSFPSSAEMVVTYRIIPSESTRKCGILECDDKNLVTAFLEKPAPEETTSRKASPCFYYFKANIYEHLKQYLAMRTSETFNVFDAPGHFVKYMAKNFPVYAIHIPHVLEVVI